ncbi:MAG: hypothetical protein FWG68_11665 [Defluviitaleaceae bacterium]|nr:hypothetical protein [Defluviitaleaceae bacterium]
MSEFVLRSTQLNNATINIGRAASNLSTYPIRIRQAAARLHGQHGFGISDIIWRINQQSTIAQHRVNDTFALRAFLANVIRIANDADENSFRILSGAIPEVDMPGIGIPVPIVPPRPPVSLPWWVFIMPRWMWFVPPPPGGRLRWLERRKWGLPPEFLWHNGRWHRLYWISPPRPPIIPPWWLWLRPPVMPPIRDIIVRPIGDLVFRDAKHRINLANVFAPSTAESAVTSVGSAVATTGTVAATSTSWGNLIADVVRPIGNIVGGFFGVGGTVVNELGNLSTGVGNIATEVGAPGAGNFLNNLGNLGNSTGNLLDSMGNALSGLGNVVTGNGNIVSDLYNIGAGTIDVIVDAGTVLNDIGQGITNGVNTVVNWLRFW